MNKIQDLNFPTNSTVEFTDTRLPTVIFDLENPGQVAVQNVLEGVSHLIPTALNVVEIINYDVANLNYVVDLTNCPGALVTWDAVPVHINIDDSIPNVYIVSGFKSHLDWDLIKLGRITTPSGYSGTFEYTVKFDYFDKTQGNSKQYTVLTIVQNVETLTQPLDFIFNVSSFQNLTAFAQIQETTVTTPTYTVTITPNNIASVTTLSSNGTGGTSTFNNTTKVLTIVGTKLQVNTHLTSIQIGTTAIEADFLLIYTASNNLTPETDTKFQTMRCNSINFLANPVSQTLFYTEDTARILADLPVVRDLAFDGSGTYTYTIYPSTTSAISTLSSTGTGGSSSFNNTTKVLTITGTRAQVNSHLLNVNFTPAIDYAENFLMYYTVITPRGGTSTATKFQNMFIGSNDTEIINMNLSRGYIANNHNFIFFNSTPVITDLDPSNPSYTITFSINSSFGLFSLGRNNNPSTTLSLTGNKDYLNSVFSQIVFYPVKGSFSTASFTYQQRKNGQLQVTQTVSLIGSNATWSGNNTIYTFSTSGSWIPTFEEVRFGGFADVVVVGGGGGGAYGGGAGGYVQTANNITISQTNYPIVVGQGGLAASTFRPSSGSYSYIGGTGGTSSGLGVAAAGGPGGRRIFTQPNTWDLSGGSNTNSSRSGGTGFITPPQTYVQNFQTRNFVGGGGGSSQFANGISASANISNSNITYGNGGTAGNTFIGLVGGGGGGARLRWSQDTIPYDYIDNGRGPQGDGWGGGGGGAYGSFGSTFASPSNGSGGAVGIRVHS